MNFLFISDSFIEDLSTGGAERADYAIFQELKNRGHECVKIHTSHPELPEYLKQFDGRVILSNFLGLSPESREILLKKRYILVEHDGKMVVNRDLAAYPNFEIPKEELINLDIYQNAEKVLLQSQRHFEIVKKNLKLDNLVAGGNFWSEGDLTTLLAFGKDDSRRRRVAVLKHPFWQKNTKGAINYCLEKDWEFQIIYPQEHKEFLHELSFYEKLVFLPLVFETYSRVCCEARCLGLEVVTNTNPSFFYEEYGKLKGSELIEALRENNEKLLANFLNWQ